MKHNYFWIVKYKNACSKYFIAVRGLLCPDVREALPLSLSRLSGYTHCYTQQSTNEWRDECNICGGLVAKTNYEEGLCMTPTPEVDPNSDQSVYTLPQSELLINRE